MGETRGEGKERRGRREEKEKRGRVEERRREREKW